MKTILNAIGLVFYAAVFLWLGNNLSLTRTTYKALPLTLDNLPEISTMQTLVGAEPDNILGPDFQKKWKKALFNKYANNPIVRKGRKIWREK